MLTLAVKRQFKNSEGIYETDFITTTVWNVIANRVADYCKKGDLISLRGRIQNNNYVDKDNQMNYRYEIIADKVSFLHTKNEDDELKDTSNDIE